MSTPKEIENPRIIIIERELKNLENAIEEINEIRKLSDMEKEEITKVNELEKDLRIKPVMRKMKEKPVLFKTKNKKI